MANERPPGGPDPEVGAAGDDVPPGQPGDSDSPFVEFDPIFQNKELLEISHMPDRDRIIGRDDQIKELAQTVNPAIFGQSPSNMLIYGKTGTGKSLCSQYISDELIKKGSERDIAIASAYIDCSQDATETQAVQSIASDLNQPRVTGLSVPATGLSTSAYYSKLWTILDQCYDVAVIILDELDRLGTDDVLLQLSRAGEAQKITRCKIGIIGISNKIKYKETMGERAKSSLCEREVVFPPYDADQLAAIMAARDEAFRDGVLEGGVISLAASFAAREHGDARKAIDILRYAGELAQRSQSETVKESFVRQARDRAQKNRFHELIAGLTPHSRYVLQAITILTINNSDDMYRTARVYEVYQRVCGQEGSDPLSSRRVRDLLQELAFLDVIEQQKHRGGKESGNYLQHTLIEDPTVVKEVLLDRESGAG